MSGVFRYIIPLVLLLACKPVKETSMPQLKPMPGKYADVSDTSNSALVSWRKYFTDSFLVALVDEGLRNNPDVAIALQKIQSTAAGTLAARGAQLPLLSANASYQHRKFGLYTMDGAGNISTDILPGQRVPIHLPDYFFGLQASWEADLWGKLRNRRRSAVARFLASVEGKNIVVTNLVAHIANAYFELLALDNQLDVLRETISIQERALELVTLQKQAAAANELAVTQFRSQLLNSKALELETLQNITEFENKINFLLGRFPQPVPRDKGTLNRAIGFDPQTGIPAQLLRNRPDLRQAELQVIAAKADVRAARAAFYPSLNISGNVGYQSFKPGLLLRTPESMAYSLLGSLAAPLLNRNAIRSAFNVADAVQVEALYEYQRSILAAFGEVSTEMSNIRNIRKIVELRTEQVEVANKSIEISSELFKTSRANYLEVLSAQHNALDTKLRLLDAKRRHYNASIFIYKALGGGWR